MRKIFIDGGANKGQSTESFLREWPNSEEFEVFMFEPNSKSPKIYGDKTTLIKKAIWIYDGQIQFHEKNPSSEGNTLLMEKVYLENKIYRTKTVDCISLSDWIKSNFSKEDYIILKLDIEGAEYEVMRHLEENNIFDFVNIFFCEIHGLKCGKSYEESMELVEICHKNKLIPYRWNGETFKFEEYKDRIYSEEHMKSEFKKWKKRGL
tara:strand:+ start:283 stop:903 length:621 start_codon:yes stop_codon:yes gene_type:complete